MNWMLESRTGVNADTFDLVRKEEIQPKGEREKATQMKNQALGFLVLLLTSFVTGVGGDQGIAELRSSVSGTLKSDEICQMEDFSAKCEAGEVIVIRSAKLGRFAMGRCIKDTKHELGCFVDVLVEMDRLCSGRRECALKVDDGTFKRSTNCHHDLKNHLWATHECVKVTLPAENCDVLRLQSGILSNFVTESSMCGVTESPWVIEVSRGQRINVTLVDFASGVTHLSKHHQQQPEVDESSSLYPRRCRVYATIREVGTTLGNSRTVCGGPDRVNAVFLSASEKIEIRFLTSRAVQKPSAKQQDSVYFLLQFNAVGCADPKLPEDMWMRRMTGSSTGSSDTATVGCDQSNLSWQLTCKDSQWKGHHGNCSTDRSVSAALGMPHALSTMIIVIIALAVSCVILTIGVLCIKRRIVEEREVRRLQRQIRSQCEADYGIGTMSSESKLGPVSSSSASAAAAAHSSAAAAVGAVILADPTGNEYARMRLQRMTDYAGCPPYGFDAPGGGGGQGCGYKYPTVEHVYESPDSLRRDDSMSRRNPHYTSRIHGGGGDQRQPPAGVATAAAAAGVGRPAKPSSPQAVARVVGPSAQEPGVVGGPCTTPNKSKNAGNYSL